MQPDSVTTDSNVFNEFNLTSFISEDYLVLATEEGYDWVLDFESGVQWEYKMNIQAFFALIPEVKISAIGKKAGINESLMRQYARGTAAVSEERMKQIEKCIQTLGRELCAVSF